MRTSLSRFTASALCTLCLLIQTPFASAQSQNETGMQETLELYVGDIFEVIPVHGLQNASYTWILTQDRTFIEASRSPVFRKRPITPGIYSLYAEISSADQSQHITRTFLLNFKPRVPGQQIDTVSGSGSMAGSGMLVQTMPELGRNNSVVLSAQTQLVRLDPVNRDIAPLAADLDLAMDTDGDANPVNDIDTKQTFFQTDATPLYMWLAQPKSEHGISVTAVRPQGAQVQMIKILDEAAARDQGMNMDDVDVNITQLSGRTYSFSANIDTDTPPNRLLFHWEFGDGKESLLTNPEHEYASDGNYTVSVRIRNLVNGQDVASYTEELTVEAPEGGPVNGSGSSEDTEPETPAANNNGIGSITSILMLVGVFIGSIIAGIAVIVLISRIRGKGKSLSDRIESMEATIVKKDEKESKTPTLSIPAPKPQEKMTTPPPSIAKREENRPNPPAATPRIEEKNAPSWLKSGLSGSPDQASAPAAPKPVTPPPASAAPVTPKPATPPAPQKAAAPSPSVAQNAPARPQQSVPAWLQTPSAAPAPVQPKPVTPPPAPQQPKPAPAAPKPVTPPPAPAVPVTPKPAAPAPAPVAPKPVSPPPAPKPVAPAAAPVTPVTPPMPVTPPAPRTPVVPPKPVTPPVPAPKPAAPAPVVPAAPAPVAPPAAPAQPATPPIIVPPQDQPIAIIRADSLEKAEGTPPQNPMPPAAQ